MVKGFVFFRDGRIPFVIEDQRMELFTDDELLDAFCKEYNFKNDYTLKGQVFRNGMNGGNATFLIEYSMGSTCYLRCYMFDRFAAGEAYDTIGFQSPFLDDIFRCKYEYSKLVRSGKNLELIPEVVYRIPFSMDGREYELSYRLGHDNRLGMMEDLDRKGEILIPVKTGEIQECYALSTVLYRLAMFMTSHEKVPFKQITLYKNGLAKGWFYSSCVLHSAVSGADVLYYDLDVMRCIPRILSNIALDSGNAIQKSIPLGHLGDYDSLFSTHRFLEQVIAFEYLYDKLEPNKAKNKKISLKEELKEMFDCFPELLQSTANSEKISTQIKELRRKITHGYTYYYDFKNDIEAKRLIILLDKLIKKMSLQKIGFSFEEIREIDRSN